MLFLCAAAGDLEELVQLPHISLEKLAFLLLLAVYGSGNVHVEMPTLDFLNIKGATQGRISPAHDILTFSHLCSPLCEVGLTWVGPMKNMARTFKRHYVSHTERAGESTCTLVRLD